MSASGLTRLRLSVLVLALALATAGAGVRFAAAAASPGTQSDCPTYNAPNTLVLAGGTPQSTKLGTPFDSSLQVALANTNGCPITTTLAGVAVTFTAPASGPSGVFSSSGSNAALVGASSSGVATAPMFTANTLGGGYLVTASSDYGSVTFSLVNTASGVPVSIAPLSAARQAAVVSNRYAHPLQVEVRDASGNPVPGAQVTFSVGSSGAAGSGAAASASFLGGAAQATEVTRADGSATSPSLVANGVAGRFTATAVVMGAAAAPITFALDNLSARPPILRALGAAHRSATVGTRYRKPLEVEVRTAQGAPVQGASVTFTLGSGGGGAGGSGGAATPGASFIGGAAQVTETTDARGVAVTPAVEADSTPGAFTAVAAVAGSTRTVSFALDNLSARPPILRVFGAAHRSATVGTRYRKPLEVEVRTAQGAPVQGASVTFTLGSGGGGAGGSGGAATPGASFIGGAAQVTETTDARGVAVTPAVEADSTPGLFTAVAAVAGSTRTVSFALDNLAGRPASIRRVGPSRRAATVDGRYARRFAVRVVDGNGKALSGQSVTFTLGSAGGSAAAAGAGASFVGGGTQATGTTDGAGIAVSPRFAAGTTAGSFTGTATATGITGSVSFSLRNLPGHPATITAGAGSSEQAVEGSRFPIPLAVTVSDKDGNAVSGAAVRFAAPARGPSGTFARRRSSVVVRTNSAGVAVAPSFVANKEAGGYVVRASVAHAGSAAFALVNAPAGNR